MVQSLISKSSSKVTRAFICPVVKETILYKDTPLMLGKHHARPVYRQVGLDSSWRAYLLRVVTQVNKTGFGAEARMKLQGEVR